MRVDQQQRGGNAQRRAQARDREARRFEAAIWRPAPPAHCRDRDGEDHDEVEAQVHQPRQDQRRLEPRRSHREPLLELLAAPGDERRLAISQGRQRAQQNSAVSGLNSQ